jgi:hypothetical protein
VTEQLEVKNDNGWKIDVQVVGLGLRLSAREALRLCSGNGREVRKEAPCECL